ncbi:MAG: uracil phosphoribosyltransferase [Gordonia sp. (in: high G+C Gram-positive bacteria)]|uniref:uracil phosphoribosyltransferase n=1 Tax=Gordonia sp. (in: high G+C Gram-positive bacteria) TaxID=84139 RepID=UPI003BB49ED9
MDDAALDLTVVNHPLVRVRLTMLRDENTTMPAFRTLLGQLSGMLVYEAMADLTVTPVSVRTPIGPCDGVAVPCDAPPLLVPVLRAGLGMLDAALGVLPEAQTGFVGLARDEETAAPTEYLVSLPENLAGRRVFVLDPMLATAGSMIHALEVLERRGADTVTVVCVIGAPEGVAALKDWCARKDSRKGWRLVIGGIDVGLNDAAYIVPGLGDAGDRLFGPRNF